MLNRAALPAADDSELPEDSQEDSMAVRPTLTMMRLRAAMSMNELAVKAGVSASTVLEIERGARPRMSTMRKIAAVLGVSPQDIGWPGDPFSKLDPEGEEPTP